MSSSAVAIGPLPRQEAWPAVARCLAASVRMLARRELHQRRTHLGRTVAFADGTTGRVYRETVTERVPREPCVLVVGFTLRRVRGAGHRAFELESFLHTPLFVGYPGFVSKLWLAHDERGRYRGLYQWDGARAAERYARSLWRLLALVSLPGSIDFRVLPGRHRDAVLADPGLMGAEDAAWWRVVAA